MSGVGQIELTCGLKRVIEGKEGCAPCVGV